MAISKVEFTEKVDTNLKANKSHDRFYINFKKDGKRIERILDYTDKQWDKRTRVSKAKQTLLELREQTFNVGLNINENSTLDQVAETYFENREDSRWKNELVTTYRVHISGVIGKKRIKDIKKIHIESVVNSMRKKGGSRQTKNGCAPRTIKKALSEALRPILKYAVDNDIIIKMPIFPEIKLNRKKKLVKNASDTFAILYKTINDLYRNDPFYLSLFLFLYFGRRWNEVRTLKWSDIDFTHQTYTIRAENNKIGQDQTYDIPLPIRVSIEKIIDERVGLVFKSPVTGKELHPPKIQLSKIRATSGVEQLTLHYFRHILVSALGEMGTAGTILSASLGHTNLSTVDNFYRTANHTKASMEANETIVKLLQNNKDESITINSSIEDFTTNRQ